MTRPADEGPPSAAPVSNAPVVLRIIGAIVLAIPGIVGLAAFVVILGIWLYEGLRFLDSDASWMPLFIIPAVAFVQFSVLTIGIVLRFARWRRAPAASLGLSLLSAAVLVLGYQLLLDAFAATDAESREMALVFSVAGLVLISAPPFLHWWNAGPNRPGKPAN